MNGTKIEYSAFAMSIVIISWLSLFSTAIAGSKKVPVSKTGDVIKIITLDNRARLCPKIDCNENSQILRLATNTELKVIASSKQELPMWDVIWYKVKYKDKQGWVSEFNTDKAPKEPRYR